MSGGLLLAWRDRQNSQIVFESKHLVHMDMVDNRGNPLSITFVYGHPQQSKKEEVWCKLRELKLIAHPKWLCIGDFNQILSNKDKFTFGDRSIPGAERLQQLISDLQLCELVAQGQQFTWMNNWEEEIFVMEKLDRAFVSVEWIEAYPNYALRNHLIIILDLGPITLDFDLQLPFRKRPFRFEQMWTTHPSCKNVVQQAWSSNTVGSRAYHLMHKVTMVRKDFIQWNREVFGKIDKEIQQKMKQLQDLHNNITLVNDISKERMLREDIETLLQREEMMWAQKARSDWILKGDRNTREDPVEIEKIFVDHFKAAYGNSTTSSVESIMEQPNTLPIPRLTNQ
nr:hypothetical protein CFP56_21398 [Quercus suber]